MRLRRISALVLAAAVATTMLTGCPWDKEEEPGSSSSSSSSSSSRPSYDDGDEDDGRPDKPNRPDRPDKPEEPEEPEEPEIPEGGYEIDEATGAYTVYTEEGLRAWAEADSDGKVSCTLAMDIALSGGWEPTGDKAGYSAVFDGQGHTISGLDQAFFAIIDGGTVRNLHLKVDIASTETYTGGVAKDNTGTIENCTVSGRIQGNGTSAGGIVGANTSGGSIRGCIVSADVKGGMASGGIAGIVQREESAKIIACCFVDGSVEGEFIGGIAGAVAGGTVTACYWSGSPEQAAGGGQGEIVSGEKVNGTTVTWKTAVDAMNAQLTGCEYEFALGSDGKPELVQKGSAEQAAAQLLKRFKK